MVGRKPKEDRSTVRTARQEFKVTSKEKRMIAQWAREDGAPDVSTWIREQCGLPDEPEPDDEEEEPKKVAV